MMRVVQVSAYRDYGGTHWTTLHTTVEKAMESLRTTTFDDMMGVNEVRIKWKGVDVYYHEHIDIFEVRTDYEAETFFFVKWDYEKKEYVLADLENE